MKITESNTFRPLTIRLESREEAEELLGILNTVIYDCTSPSQMSVNTLRAVLNASVGVPMTDTLYTGRVTRIN